MIYSTTILEDEFGAREVIQQIHESVVDAVVSCQKLIEQVSDDRLAYDATIPYQPLNYRGTSKQKRKYTISIKDKKV